MSNNAISCSLSLIDNKLSLLVITNNADHLENILQKFPTFVNKQTKGTHCFIEYNTDLCESIMSYLLKLKQ